MVTQMKEVLCTARAQEEDGDPDEGSALFVAPVSIATCGY